MKTGVNRKTFFTKKEFEILKEKHQIPLNYIFYKQLIKTYNKFLCEKILESQNGALLPYDLGTIHIKKYKPSKPVYTEKNVIDKEYNFHTFGYIYFFRWERGFKYENTKKRNYGIKAKMLKFYPHRRNLKRPLAQRIKTGLNDYPIAK